MISKKPKKKPKNKRDTKKKQNWVGDKAPNMEIALPYAYLDIDINAIQTSSTLEDLLNGRMISHRCIPDISEKERKTYHKLTKMHRELKKTYEHLMEGEPRIERVYETKYIGPLSQMFIRDDKLDVKWVTQKEAEFVHLLMQEIHSMVIRSLNWNDISARLGLDIYRLMRLWGRYQKCIDLYGSYDKRTAENMYYQRCEYVLSRLMRLAEQNDDVHSWIAVSKALEPMGKIAQDTADAKKAVNDAKKDVIARIKRNLETQRKRWIEEGKNMQRKSNSIEVGLEPKTRFMDPGESLPPEFEEIGDI